MIKSINLKCRSLSQRTSLACAFIATVVLIPAAILNAEDFKKFDTHKVLYVISKSAETMSSPNESGYSTGILRQGDVVDAYGQLGQWLAIRPPVGQFDWLAAQHAHLLPGGRVAEIIDSPAPAWIHTDHKDRGQFQWQIKLQPTQQVNVAEQFIQKLDNGQSRAWYKIDPPPGEFRWVLKDGLSDSPSKPSLVQHSKKEGSSSTSNNGNSSAVQQASSTIVNVTSEPVVLAPGEVIVGHDQDPLWDASDTPSGVAQAPNSLLVDEATGQPITVDLSGSGIVGRLFGPSGPRPTAGCPNCTSDACCSECTAGFANTPMHRIHPINRLLSCIGISIVEAERPVVAPSCGGCGLPTCATCNGLPAISRAGTIGSLPSRLDTLPRPNRNGVLDEFGDSVIIDRLGAARKDVRDSIAQTKERIEDRTQSLLTNPAKVSLGSPLRNALGNRQPIFGGGQNQPKDSGWQGLPQNGISNEDLELDVEAPTATFEANRRTEDSSTQGTGRMLQTSAPGHKDQSRFDPPSNEGKAMEPTSTQLQRVVGELTSIVSLPTEQWKLNTLHDEVLVLIENGEDPVVRGEARLLLERIESFEDFRARWMRANSNKIVSAQSSTNLLTSTDMNRVPVQTASFQNKPTASETSKPVTIKDMAAAQAIIQAADASGWLVAVHSERDDYPKFALTDDAGQLVSYVEAGPSLNLRGYLKQPVALHGQRGMNTLLKARTIYAERVIRISDGK